MLKGSKIEVPLNVGAEELVSAVWRVAKATPDLLRSCNEQRCTGWRWK